METIIEKKFGADDAKDVEDAVIKVFEHLAKKPAKGMYTITLTLDHQTPMGGQFDEAVAAWIGRFKAILCQSINISEDKVAELAKREYPWPNMSAGEVLKMLTITPEAAARDFMRHKVYELSERQTGGRDEVYRVAWINQFSHALQQLSGLTVDRWNLIGARVYDGLAMAEECGGCVMTPAADAAASYVRRAVNSIEN